MICLRTFDPLKFYITNFASAIKSVDNNTSRDYQYRVQLTNSSLVIISNSFKVRRLFGRNNYYTYLTHYKRF